MSSPDSSSSGGLPLRKLGIVLLVLALAAGAGCTGVLDSGNSGDGSGNVSLVENVPADQNALIEIDPGILQDETTQRLFQEGGSQGQDTPSQAELEAGLAYVEAETGLDPRKVENVLIFGKSDEVTDVQNPTQTSGSNEQVGILVSTDWSQEQVTSAFQNTSQSTLEQASYEAQSGVLYRVVESTSDTDEPTYLGVLGSGTFVLGDEASVRASLDTEYAGASSLSGDLLEAHENTRDGLVSASVLVPEENRSTSQFGEIRAMTGVYYTNGSTIGMEGRILLGSSQDATRLNQTMQFAMLSLQDDPQYSKLFEHLTVSQEGSDVVFTYESDVQTLVEASDSA